MKLGEIDVDNLDVMWVEHVRKVADVAKEIPRAKLRVNKAKARMELVEAELKFAVRTDPVTYHLKSKPSNSEVDACVLMQAEYQEAQKAYFLARKDADYLDSAMTVLDHEKRALEDLVRLFGMNYFSKPTVDEETHRKAKVHFDKVDANSGLGRRRKK